LFKVVATDRKGTGLSGNATIVIYVDDVNEFAPRFLNRYSFTLAANTPLGHVFGKLEAEDYDITPQNKHVTYLLTRGGGNKFAIDYETGMSSNWVLTPHCIQSSRVLVPAGTSKSTSCQ
jgi:hypothetical protein